MADQRRFDLQFEFMVFIIRVCLVMLQTGPKRNHNHCIIMYFCKLHHSVQITWEKNKQKQKINLLCEKEEAVIRQTQESAARQNSFEQMVQLSESNHLFLQIHLSAQVIRLW